MCEVAALTGSASAGTVAVDFVVLVIETLSMVVSGENNGTVNVDELVNAVVLALVADKKELCVIMASETGPRVSFIGRFTVAVDARGTAGVPPKGALDRVDVAGLFAKEPVLTISVSTLKVIELTNDGVFVLVTVLKRLRVTSFETEL